jgi:hypothetical protein
MNAFKTHCGNPSSNNTATVRSGDRPRAMVRDRHTETAASRSAG